MDLLAHVLPPLRPDERHDTGAAALGLFGLLASHTILETARDALFLTHLPAARLPVVYVGIALMTVLALRARPRLTARLGGRAALGASILAAAAITLAFYVALPWLGGAGYYALYVWSGVLIAFLLAQYWTRLAERFSASQARRVYGVIASAGVLGAIVGSGIAGLLARPLGAAQLVLVAALGLAVTAATPLGLAASGRAPSRADATAPGASLAVLHHPYVRRVAALLVLAAACLTVVDFLFKTILAASVPARDLATYLAGVALALNLLALVVQLFGVTLLLRRAGVMAAVAVLPALLVAGGLAVLVGPVLVTVFAVKVVDGSLRHSLQRTATELLFVPMPEVRRRQARALLDVTGQRGGQVIASVALLVLVAAGAPLVAVVALFLALAASWLWCAVALRRSYVDQFRGRLAGPTADDAVLDDAALRTLVAALDADEPAEVVAALDLLDRAGRPELVPALILHHPSDAVVVRALDVVARTSRPAARWAIDRRIVDGTPRVRAAALAARTGVAPDHALLRARLADDPAPEVRAVARAHLAARGDDPRPAATLRALLVDPEPATRAAAARAIGAHGLGALAPAVIDRLADAAARPDARAALHALGDAAFPYVEAALVDRLTPRAVRLELPASLTGVAPARAAALLTRTLDDDDGALRDRGVGALERLVRAHPEVIPDARALDRAIERTVIRAYRCLDRARLLARGEAAAAWRRTPGRALLRRLLDDERDHAVDLLLRLLALRWPRERFADMRRGLARAPWHTRAAGVELIANVLRPPLRDAVIGLLDDAPDDERAAAGAPFHAPRRLDDDALLAELAADGDDAVGEVARYHQDELAACRPRPELALAAGAVVAP